MLEESILISTKKVLNIPHEVDAFNLDVLMHINAAFSILSDLGVFDEAGVTIEAETTWEELQEAQELTNPLTVAMIQMLRTYVFLRVRMLFDPPTTGFLLTAMENQLKELEWRISTKWEYAQREEV
jgi:hypothetical protein